MWLLVALLGWPLMEIGLFVVIGGQIGLWATLAWVVLSAVLGVLALRIIAVRQALALRDGLRAVRDPARLAAGGVMGVVGAALLILPGFLTDALGLLLLLPPVQLLVARAVLARVKVVHAGSGSADVVEGEFVELPPRHDPPADWPRID